MAEAKAATTRDTEAARPARRRRTPLVAAIAVAVLVLLGGGGAAAWWFVKGAGDNGGDGSGTPAAAAAAARRGAPSFLPLDVFTVNIKGIEGSEHFLQVGLTLQTADARAGERVKEHMPLIRNSLLLLLSSKTADELKSIEGKERLQKDILAAARTPLPGSGPEKGIEGVLFSSFVIQ